MSTGSLSPATYPTDAITIRCDRCSRVGRYKRRMLIERYGSNAAMPDVLNEITACERNHSLSVERCKVWGRRNEMAEPITATARGTIDVIVNSEPPA